MVNNKPHIAVLALQGCVERHRPHIEAAGAGFMAAKTPEDFARADAFILPGGESTAMLKLIENFGLWEPLAENFRAKPVWGICAGAILIAKKVSGPAQKSFALMDINAVRNAYGRQLESVTAEINGYPVSYIRAPLIEAANDGIEVLAEREGAPVWVKQGPYMATVFHPELTLNYPSPMHRAFIDMVLFNAKSAENRRENARSAVKSF